jgi:hypothetical protein
VDVAFAVCTALAQRDLTVVLVGGSAATYYAPSSYQSYDADFVAHFVPDRKSQSLVVEVMRELGYHVKDNLFVHSSNPFTVDFPKGPLGIGNEVLKHFDPINRDGQLLNVITPADSVRDRLAKYYFWDDFSALNAAIEVTKAHRNRIDIESIRAWSTREGEDAKFQDFLDGI